MTADAALADLDADARRRVPDPPPIDEIIEDTGRQRLAAYYLYSALISGVIGDADLAAARWPPVLAESMAQLGLSRFAPRTERGLDAELTPAEQVTRQSRARKLEFAQLLVDVVNHGAFGPLCGDADRVRLAGPGEGNDLALELIKDGRVVGSCPVQGHWELVAQYLAAAAPGGTPDDLRSAEGSGRTAEWLKTSGIAHAVSLSATLAVHLHPLGAAAGLGTRLVLARIRPDRDQADALRSLGQELASLQAQAASEVADLQPASRG
jgi:hypothetical protein